MSGVQIPTFYQKLGKCGATCNPVTGETATEDPLGKLSRWISWIRERWAQQEILPEQKRREGWRDDSEGEGAGWQTCAGNLAGLTLFRSCAHNQRGCGFNNMSRKTAFIALLLTVWLLISPYLLSFNVPIHPSVDTSPISCFGSCEQCSHKHGSANVFEHADSVSFGYVPRRKVVKSQGSFIFNFLRNLHTTIYNECHHERTILYTCRRDQYWLRTLQDQALSTKEMYLPQRDKGKE